MLVRAVDIVEAAVLMKSRKTNAMTLIRIKVWESHSLSRINNGNTPFSYGDITNRLGKEDYLRYIDLELIDVSDLGGKDEAKEVISKWFS